MIRQYRILYKRGAAANFGTLDPVANKPLWDRPEIAKGVGLMRDNPEIEGLAIRLGDELFNIVSFLQPAVAPKSFTFPGATA